MIFLSTLITNNKRVNCTNLNMMMIPPSLSLFVVERIPLPLMFLLVILLALLFECYLFVKKKKNDDDNSNNEDHDQIIYA
jgi:hypothetical protein